jgi:hypothetical protein
MNRYLTAIVFTLSFVAIAEAQQTQPALDAQNQIDQIETEWKDAAAKVLAPTRMFVVIPAQHDDADAIYINCYGTIQLVDKPTQLGVPRMTQRQAAQNADASVFGANGAKWRAECIDTYLPGGTWDTISAINTKTDILKKIYTLKINAMPKEVVDLMKADILKDLKSDPNFIAEIRDEIMTELKASPRLKQNVIPPKPAANSTLKK